MRIPIAIVIAGLLIAAAILIGFRWQISAATGGVVYRLDEWSGDVIACPLFPDRRTLPACVRILPPAIGALLPPKTE